VAYTVTSPLFGDRERYPRFYRIVPDIAQYIVGYSEILRELNWKRVAVIYYEDEFSLNVCGNNIQYDSNHSMMICM